MEEKGKKILKRGLAFTLALAMIVGNNSYYSSSSLRASDSDESTTEVETQSEEIVVDETPVEEAPAEEPVTEEPVVEEPVVEETVEEEVSEEPVEAEEESTKKSDESKPKTDSKESDDDTGEEEKVAFNQTKTISGLKVTATAEAGVLPAGTEMTTKILASNAEQASVENQLDARGIDYDGFTAIDITFVKDGQEIEPDGKVNVSFELAESKIAATNDEVDGFEDIENKSLEVLHFVENEAGAVTSVQKVADVGSETSGSVQVNGSETKVMSQFKVESFSTFVLIWNNNTSKPLNIKCVDTSGNEIGVDYTLNVSDHTEQTRYVKQYARTIDGYKLNSVKYVASGKTTTLTNLNTNLTYSNGNWKLGNTTVSSLIFVYEKLSSSTTTTSKLNFHHIDIKTNVTFTAVIDGVSYENIPFELTTADQENITVTAKYRSGKVVTRRNDDNSKSNSDTFYWAKTTTTSDSANGSQIRLIGDNSTDANNTAFPTGTIENPVDYTITFNKDITIYIYEKDGKKVATTKVSEAGRNYETYTVPVSLQMTTNYWDFDNRCPELYSNNQSQINWANGEAKRYCGIDLVFSDATGSLVTKGKIDVSKEVKGLSIVDGKVFNFNIYKVVDGKKESTPYTTASIKVNSSGKGTTAVANLPLGTYYVEEVTTGSQIQGYNLTVTYPTVAGDTDGQQETITQEDPSGVVSVVNTYTSTVIDETPDESYITVQKTFNGNNGNLPKDFSIVVHKDNASGDVIATLNFADATLSGNTYTWKVTGVGSGTYYAVENNAGNLTGYVLTSHTGDNEAVTVQAAELAPSSNTTRINAGDTVEKEFSGNLVSTSLTDGTFFVWTPDHISASQRLAIVNLLANAGGRFESITVENTKFFSGSAIEDEDGLHYRGQYKIFVKDGVRYVGMYSDSGKGAQWQQVALGTYESDVTSVSGTKVWSNAEATHPTIKINLLRNNVEVDTVTLTSGQTEFEFNNLKVFDANGNRYVYTVTEDAVTGYTTTVDGTTITNTYAPGTTSVSGTKVWSNPDEAHPTITVNLYQDGGLYTSKQVTNGTTSFTFSNLPKYNSLGAEYVYTVGEEAVTGYTTTVSGTTITNTYNPELTQVDGVKVWSNPEATHPTIKVNLLQNGSEIASKELKNGETEYSFTNLPVTDSLGVAYTYTVSEDAVNGYTTTVDGTTITNTYAPGTTKVEGTKVWSNSGATHPSITINLLQNGKEIDEVVLENGTTDYKFENLDKYDTEGKEYKYTVTEDAVTGYTTTVSGTTITNTYAPGTTEVKGTKVWSNKDEDHPTITVNLYQDGEFYTSKQVTNGTTSFTFSNLPKYNSLGKEYKYTVGEAAVTGYDTKVEGTTITNTYNPELITIEGTKTWSNADAKHPTITIKLLQNGKEYKSVELTNGTVDYKFDKLPKTDSEGKTYTYALKEVSVTGYESVINGYNVINTYKPETTDIKVTKVWSNPEATHPTIKVNLLRNGDEIASKELKNGETEYTFSNLPKTDSEGKAYTYTVTEDSLISYTTKVDGYNITNTYNPGVTEVKGTKVWSNKDAKHPSITINLLQNGKEIDEVTLKNGETEYSFKDLPIYDSVGEAYTYTVTEDAVTGYDTKIEGTKITNTYNPELTKVEGTKTWSNPGATHPTITINLLQNGEEIAEVTLKNGETEYSFDKLPVTDTEGKVYTYTVTEDEITAYSTKVEGYNITNTYEPGTVKVEGTKTWSNPKADHPSITINLLQNGKEIDEVVLENGTTDYKFENLDKYDSLGKEYKYTVTEDAVVGYTTKVNGYDIVNTYAPDTTKVEGTKTWSNPDAKHPTITINLLQNGEKIDSTTVENGSSTYKFENLDKYDSLGNEYIYTVTENKVTGYDTKIEGTKITNTYNPELIDIAGTKTWSNPTAEHPTITINLLQNGEEIKEVKLKNGTTDYKFEKLPKTDSEGNAYTYKVTEDAVVGYTTKVNGYDIVNTYSPDTTKVEGTKTWSNPDAKHPTITINLLQNGKEYAEVQLVNGKTDYKFENLPVTDSKGVEYEYTVTEDAVTGYDTTIEGTEIVNTYNPELIEVAGTKTWSNPDEVHPTITINLLQNGEEIDEVQLPNGVVEYAFTELPKTDSEGKEYVYTVTEDKVTGYTTVVDKYNITNTYSPETTKVEGTKTWSNPDAKHPSITINLLQNGKEIDEVTLKNGETEYSFIDLPVTDSEGVEYEYTVTEDVVTGYDTVVSGYNITNTYNPKLTKVEGTKTWSNPRAEHPSITINLLQNGEEIDEVTLKNGETEYSFIDLPVTDSEGKKYTYTVTEDKVTAYSTEIDGYNITNTYEPGTTKVEGTKTWSNPDAKHPSITINLLQNGKEIDEVVLENGTTDYKFENLDKYDTKGEKYVYTVTEDAVTGYDTKIEGTKITNTYNPELTKVEGVKTWSNKDAAHPSITINLLQNGEEIDEVTLKNGETEYSFDKLPVTDSEGKKYKYTITEDAVTGYDTIISGTNVTNTYNPELIKVEGTKTWSNPDATHPTITINLLQNGKEIDEVKLVNGVTKYEFKDLPKTDSEGKAYTYTVTEDSLISYTTKVDGYNITNTYNPGVTEVKGTKVWSNKDAKHPSITINLLQNGKEIDEVTLKNGETEYSFKDLPIYDSVGKAYTYTVTEDAVTGYDTKIEGTKITNTYNPELTKVEGTKTWSNPTAEHPSITINLLQNGKEIDEVTLKNGETEYSFDKLPVTDTEGKTYTYTVTEDEITAYSTKVEGYNITNTYEPGTVKVEGTKTWSNPDAKHPSITINLLQNGEEIDEVVLENGTTDYKFENLDKYDSLGKEYKYTVTEDEVTGYDTTIEEYDITNTYNPELVDIDGTKEWVNVDDNYPTITINLLQNGEEIDEVVLENGETEYSFKDLPKTDSEGNVYTYEVSEDEVVGYDQVINGYDIVNTYNPELIDVEGTKTWSNPDDKHPSITINLLQNGEEIDEVVLENGTTDYKFENLPKTDTKGDEYEYTVTEDEVKAYDTEIEGYDITNTYNPERTDITVNKVWDDEDNTNGLRPEEIKVNLYAYTLVDDEKVYVAGDVEQDEEGNAIFDSVTLTEKDIDEDGNWSYTWTELALVDTESNDLYYEVYEVEEDVEYYTASYEEEQDDEGNTTVTITNKLDRADLTINKAVDGSDGFLNGETFAFLVTGTNKAGETVYSSTFGLTGAGSIKVENVPVKGITYTIKEVYAGSIYQGEGTKEVSITEEDGEYTVTPVNFTNTITPKVVPGTGVVNHYSSNGTYTYTQEYEIGEMKQE